MTAENTTKNIQVIYTGGTIGMHPSAAGLVPDSALGAWLKEQLAGTDFEECVRFTQLDPLIDSSNATPATWQQIVEAVRSACAEATAFVILHGTDTMAYTAAALSFALPDISAPIIVTGAQLPLTEFGSDALTNLMGALQAAVHPGLAGVYIFFGRHLLRGNRATKLSAWDFEAFGTPEVEPVAQMAGPWKWAEEAEEGVRKAPAARTTAVCEHYNHLGLSLPAQPFAAHDVLVVHVVPGLTAQRLAALLDPLPKAVILRAYGTGNVPAEEPGFVEVLARASAQGCVVVASSQCVQPRTELHTYAAGHVLLGAGVVSGGDAVLEALYAKVIFLLSQGLTADRVRELIGIPLAGELTRVGEC
ncbi:MAG: asparaginase [Arcanobacterium sp.]|nr:asparaginase [Arcanobacterium sp.]MDY5588560.1 asparaginase [Arcanobacterium sp.]